MLNLILDLDSTLIHSVFPVSNNYFLKNIIGADMINIRYTITKNKIKNVNKNKKTKKKQKKNKTQKKVVTTTEFLCFKRKQLNIFLRYCFNNFNVGFWSSGETIYVENILKNILLPEEYKKCICIVSRVKMDEDAVYFKDSINNKRFKIENVNKTVVKKLSYIYNNKITSENTLLLDDDTRNKAANCKNTILIPAYEYNINNDDCLFLLIEQFEKIKNKKTINTLDFNKIEDLLFKNYKLNDKYTNIVKNYNKKDSVQINDDNIKAYNNDIMILETNKNNYKIMYVDDKTKNIITTTIGKKKVELKYLLN